MLLDLIFVSVLLQDSLPAARAVTLLRVPLTDPNAVCNDGSQAVYYHQQVSVSARGFPNQNYLTSEENLTSLNTLSDDT